MTYHLSPPASPRRATRHRRAVGDDGLYTVASLPPPMPVLMPLAQTPAPVAQGDNAQKVMMTKIIIGVVVVIALLWLLNEMTKRQKVARNPRKYTTSQLAAMLHARLEQRNASPTVLRSLAAYANQR